MKLQLKNVVPVLTVLFFTFHPANTHAETATNAFDAQLYSQERFYRVYFTDPAIARKIVISLNAIESNYEKGYIIVQISSTVELNRLLETDVQIEEITDPLKDKFAEIEKAALIQTEAIPGYPCYRTVEETFAAAETLVANYPNLATWSDTGDSWEKSNSLGGYDMMVLKLTNSTIGGDKPIAFFTGALHAREYTTAELLMRLAEYLTENYGTDADATWMLDYHEVHIILHANPDGRKQAETGLSWRKNTNQNYCSPTSNYRGADLNRNFTFKWNCCGGSSSNPCATTYHGPYAASEPETQTIENYMTSLFPDLRGPNDTDAAPLDAEGIYIDVHSHGRLVIWPWGWTETPPPNASELQTFGRKMAFFNDHTPQQAIGLYPTDGTTDDHLYGELGIASYCIELGTEFFESCSYFENTLLPANFPTFLYAIKVARTPYITPSGPDAVSVALDNGSTPIGVPAGTNVLLTASVNDTRYNNSNGTEPTQIIAAAEYYVDTPPWVTSPTPVPVAMSATDGNFNSTVESVQATINTTGWSEGKHTVFVRGKDLDTNWGAFSAVFLYINNTGDTTPPTPDPMTWTIAPQATGPTTITMTATTATDPSGVEYYFECLTTGGHSSGWQSSTVYTDTDLLPSTQYTYRVKARDQYVTPNETEWSSQQSATTQEQPQWTELTYDDFESGFGNYTDGGKDCALYTGGSTYAHQGTNAGNIQDNSGTVSSFYHTNGIDVHTPGYTEIKVEFWFKTNGMESGDDFWIQYYNGSTWTTVAQYISGTDFNNGSFYNDSIFIDESSYTFPADMKIRFMCDANHNNDDVYIDEVRVSAGY